jgi:hypothetical protein
MYAATKGGARCAECDVGKFAYVGSSVCSQCPEEGVECNPKNGKDEPGLAGVYIMDGYFMTHIMGGDMANTTLRDQPLSTTDGDEMEEMQPRGVTVLVECPNADACVAVQGKWLTKCAEGFEGARCAECDTKRGYLSRGPGTFQCQACGVAATSGDSEESSWLITAVSAAGFCMFVFVVVFLFITTADKRHEFAAVKKVAMHWRRINQAQHMARRLDEQARSAGLGLPWLTENNMKIKFNRNRTEEIDADRQKRNQGSSTMEAIQNAWSAVSRLKRNTSNSGKIVMGNFQVLTGMATVFTIPWPAEFTNFLTNIGGVAFDFTHLLTFVDPCALQSDFMKGFVIQMLMPPAIGLCGLGALMCGHVIVSLRKTRERRQLKSLRNELVEAARTSCNGSAGNIPRKERRRSSLVEKMDDVGYGTSAEDIEKREKFLTPAEFHKAWPYTYDALSSAFRTHRRSAARKSSGKKGAPIHYSISSDAPSSWLYTRSGHRGSGKKGVAASICKVVTNVQKETKKYVNRKYSTRSMKMRLMKFFNIVAFVMYPTLCSKIFVVFKCDLVGDERYFSMDYSKRCFADDLAWNLYAVIAGIMVLVYVCGIPLAVAVLLYKGHRRNVLYATNSSGDVVTAYMEKNKYVEHRSVAEMYGDIYEQYTPQAWYFEILVMIYKMLLTGGLILIREGTSIQIVFGIVVAFTWTGIIAFLKPYAVKTESHLAMISAGQVFLTMLVGLALKTDMEASQWQFIGYAMVLLNMCTLAFAIFVIGSQIGFIERKIGKAFRRKAIRCQFDVCTKKGRAFYNCCSTIRKKLANNDLSDNVSEIQLVPRRRDFIGAVLKDEFYVNKYRPSEKRVRRVDVQELRSELHKTKWKSSEAGEQAELAAEMAELKAWVTAGASHKSGLKAKLGVRVRRVQLESQLRYFYSCFHPQRTDESAARYAETYSGRGIDGERELNALLHENYGSDLTAVAEWDRVPLVARLETFYAKHAPSLRGTGAAEATAEHYEHDLDSLLVRLSTVYDTSIVEQIKEFAPVAGKAAQDEYYETMKREHIAHIEEMLSDANDRMGMSTQHHNLQQARHVNGAAYYTNPMHGGEDDMHDMFMSEISARSDDDGVAGGDSDDIHAMFTGGNPMPKRREGKGGDELHELFDAHLTRAITPVRASAAATNINVYEESDLSGSDDLFAGHDVVGFDRERSGVIRVHGVPDDDVHGEMFDEDTLGDGRDETSDDDFAAHFVD